MSDERLVAAVGVGVEVAAVVGTINDGSSKGAGSRSNDQTLVRVHQRRAHPRCHGGSQTR